MRGSGARLVTTAIVADSRFPFPQSLQKSGNSNREVHRLSRFRNHQTACSCLQSHRLSSARRPIAACWFMWAWLVGVPPAPRPRCATGCQQPAQPRGPGRPRYLRSGARLPSRPPSTSKASRRCNVALAHPRERCQFVRLLPAETRVQGSPPVPSAHRSNSGSPDAGTGASRRRTRWSPSDPQIRPP